MIDYIDIYSHRKNSRKAKLCLLKQIMVYLQELEDLILIYSNLFYIFFPEPA